MQAVGELLVARNALPVLAKRLDDEKSASAKELKEASDQFRTFLPTSRTP